MRFLQQILKYLQLCLSLHGIKITSKRFIALYRLISCWMQLIILCFLFEIHFLNNLAKGFSTRFFLLLFEHAANSLRRVKAIIPNRSSWLVRIQISEWFLNFWVLILSQMKILLSFRRRKNFWSKFFLMKHRWLLSWSWCSKLSSIGY